MPVTYIPILNVRPAELTAITEVPDVAKDRMLPLFIVRPWLGRGSLNRATDRIVQGIGDRQWIAELGVDFVGEDESVQDEIDSLGDSANAFEKWKQYVSELPNAIPAAIVCDDFNLFGQQIANLSDIGRGVAIRFDRTRPIDLLEYVGKLPDNLGENLTVVLDYGQTDERLLTRVITAAADCRAIMEVAPNSQIAVSATTFPSSFDGVSSGVIYERGFYNSASVEIPSNTLIYSDHGSARFGEERGGGVPRPRIDLPRDQRWYFFRSDLVRDKDMDTEEYKELRNDEYQIMADNAINSSHWDPNLNIWGTQFIKITQLGSEWGINSPAKATACRINIHLTRQALYGSEISSTDLEEDWVD